MPAVYLSKFDYLPMERIPVFASEGQVLNDNELTRTPHSHDFEEIVAITEGSGTHMIQGNSYTVRAGDVFLIQKDQEHYFVDRDQMGYMNIAFLKEGLPLPWEHLKALPGFYAFLEIETVLRSSRPAISHVRLSNSDFLDFTMLAREMVRQSSDGSRLANLEVYLGFQRLLLLMIKAYNQPKTKPSEKLYQIGKVLSFLESNYEKSVELRELCKMANMSQSTFIRQFGNATHLSPIQYLLRLRIKKGKELLRATHLGIPEIAAKVGFEDSNYFTRQFKKVVGMSPINYRSRLLKNSGHRPFKT